MSKPQRAWDERDVDSPGYDRLALLYQTFLIAVVRIQSKRQRIDDPPSFRKKMKTILSDIQRSAGANYSQQDISDANLAVTAFLDEVVIGLDDESLRTDWKHFALAQEILHEDNAGDVFVRKLEAILESGKDSLQTADVLEIYLLCLMLGFEGQYSGRTDGGKYSVMEKTRARIETIRRYRGRPLSPEANIVDEPTVSKLAHTGDEATRELTRAAAGAGLAAVLLFIMFKIHLYLIASRVLQTFNP